jgi:hypothetical protein
MGDLPLSECRVFVNVDADTVVDVTGDGDRDVAVIGVSFGTH